MTSTISRNETKSAVPEALTRLGFEIHGFGPLPDGFDPLTATPRQLAAHRLPRRPDAATHPELRAMWDRAMARTKQWIVPEFEYMEGRSHGPAVGTYSPGDADAAATNNATSTNWSGAVVSAPTNKPFSFVAGQWTVPDPNSAVVGSFSASEWVGIDGWGSKDVLQAGTRTDVLQLGFLTSKNVYAWWEWFGAYEVKLGNLPVTSGDIMYCLICADSSTHATMTFSNQSQGVGTRFQVTAPERTSLVGNVAEWIVERPEVNGSITQLTDYDACYFDQCIAGGTNGTSQIVNLSGATLVTMTGTGGATLSWPIRENDGLLKVNWLKSS